MKEAKGVKQHERWQPELGSAQPRSASDRIERDKAVVALPSLAVQTLGRQLRVDGPQL